MPPIPQNTSLDSTLAFVGDPDRFISRECRRHRSDLFQTRLLLQQTICMTGAEAAAIVYDPDRFVRHGAAPARLQQTLFGRGGVQGLDGARHRQRKQMFMSLMTPDQVASLSVMVTGYFRSSAIRWASMDEVVFYDEFRWLLTRAVCDWDGLPLSATEASRRTRELTGLFDAAGAVGPLHWWSRLARRRSDDWAASIIAEIRAGRQNPPEHSAAHVVAWHREPDGQLLSQHVAAVELLNVLRPTVAVAVYLTFVAHALRQFPDVWHSIRSSEEEFPEWFVQEVRRFYPFFPAVMARVRRDFEWQGYHFPRHRRVVLDLYGVNHDARTWDSPEEFRPARFRDWDGDSFTLVPQGGGDHAKHHRCAGEWITIALMKMALSVLTQRITYDVPAQDLRINYSRLPALPRSRFVSRNVGLRE